MTLNDFFMVVASIALLVFCGAFAVWFCLHVMRALLMVGGPARAFKKEYAKAQTRLAAGERMPDTLAHAPKGVGPRDYPSIHHHGGMHF